MEDVIIRIKYKIKDQSKKSTSSEPVRAVLKIWLNIYTLKFLELKLENNLKK